jgi:hypothetical protein
VRRLRGRTSSGQVWARPATRVRGRPLQLLLGHLDTVWPVGTLAEMPFEVDGDTVRGPGVFDMKGGLVMLLLALGALRRQGVEPPLTPLVFVNSDEEIGSHESRAHIRASPGACAGPGCWNPPSARPAASRRRAKASPASPSGLRARRARGPRPRRPAPARSSSCPT